MKKLISLVVFMTIPGLASAGGLENAAVSAGLTGLDLSTAKAVTVPVPEKAVSPQAWIEAVKKEYERPDITGLPKARMSELPEAAKKQLEEDNHIWGPDYLSAAFKMKVQGKTAFIIQNENESGWFINIFDENGEHIAAGGWTEASGEFSWDEVSAVSKAYVPARVTRRCWDYEKKMLELTFVGVGGNTLILKKAGLSCTISRDKTYPSGHVPQEYQNWFRYYENAKVDESTSWGRENPCTKVFGIASPGGDLFGVFRELRLDSDLAKPLFAGSAALRVQMIGDGAGPAKANYICR